jgi:hypothetical protein
VADDLWTTMRREYEEECLPFSRIVLRHPGKHLSRALLRERARKEGWERSKKLPAKQLRIAPQKVPASTENGSGHPKSMIRIADVLGFRGKVLTKRQLAVHLCIGTKALNERCAENPELAAAVEEVLTSTIAMAEDKLVKLVKAEDPATVRWVCATRGGGDYRDRHELTGADGGPLQIEGKVTGTVDIMAAVAHFALVLATNGAQTHARQQIIEAESGDVLDALAPAPESVPPPAREETP